MTSDIPFLVSPRDRVSFSEDAASDLRTLFHQLNNQLGIILANAELLHARLGEADSSARAGHIVSSTVEAIATAKNIHGCVKRSND